MKCPTRLFAVRVDLSQLSYQELQHLHTGTASMLELRARNDDSRRVWTVPPEALWSVELELDEPKG